MAEEAEPQISGPKRARAGGRQTALTPEALAKAEGAYAMGATDEQVAELLEVTARSISLWKVTRPEFAAICKLNKDLVDDKVEATLYQKATGGIPGVPPDTTAMIFWLKNRRRKEWRDVRQLGNDPENPLPGGVESDEQVKRIAERLRALKLADPGEGSDLV